MLIYLEKIQVNSNSYSEEVLLENKFSKTTSTRLQRSVQKYVEVPTRKLHSTRDPEGGLHQAEPQEPKGGGQYYNILSEG